MKDLQDGVQVENLPPDKKKSLSPILCNKRIVSETKVSNVQGIINTTTKVDSRTIEKQKQILVDHKLEITKDTSISIFEKQNNDKVKEKFPSQTLIPNELIEGVMHDNTNT